MIRGFSEKGPHERQDPKAKNQRKFGYDFPTSYSAACDSPAGPGPSPPISVLNGDRKKHRRDSRSSLSVTDLGSLQYYPPHCLAHFVDRTCIIGSNHATALVGLLSILDYLGLAIGILLSDEWVTDTIKRQQSCYSDSETGVSRRCVLGVC